MTLKDRLAIPLIIRENKTCYNSLMKAKFLANSNPFLKDRESARRQIIRSIASSTAVETGVPIKEIENKLKKKSSPHVEYSSNYRHKFTNNM